eukprot:s5092_g5.t1
MEPGLCASSKQRRYQDSVRPARLPMAWDPLRSWLPDIAAFLALLLSVMAAFGFVQSFGATSEAAQLRAWAALPWKPVPCSVQDMGVAYRGTCSLDSDQERYEEKDFAECLGASDDAPGESLNQVVDRARFNSTQGLCGRTRNCLDPARSRVPAIMALSGAGSSVAFAIAPATAVRTCAPAHAEAKPAPGKISQSSLPVACAGLMVPVLGAVRRGKKKLKTAMKDATYAFQKDAYADLEFTNDVGYLPDGTPLNKAGNAVNHPETIGADRHVAGSPLPRAKFVNSVGYLPDGTAMNAAGNAINHPEAMQPDQHIAGSPLPPSTYLADIGYLADGTPLATAGNNSVKGSPATPPAATATAAPPRMVSSAPPPASIPASQGIAMHGRKFEYSFQKDAYADLEFNNDVGYLPDGTALNRAGGIAMHGRKFEYSFQKDAYADLEFNNDVGYLPDGTALNRAGNAINHPETIGPDRHAPGSPLPRANFVNSVGYLPDGTPLNRAGNAINHPESIGPDMHAPGSPLPATAAPPGMVSSAPTTASTPVSQGIAMHGRKFEYSFQKDAYADLEFNNDVGYLPDGTALNRAGNAINHPETIGPDRHAPGSPLPRANFVNSVGYLPDGTPLNRAGNAINHPESIGPDMHAPGSPLPATSQTVRPSIAPATLSTIPRVLGRTCTRRARHCRLQCMLPIWATLLTAHQWTVRVVVCRRLDATFVRLQLLATQVSTSRFQALGGESTSSGRRLLMHFFHPRGPGDMVGSRFIPIAWRCHDSYLPWAVVRLDEGVRCAYAFGAPKASVYRRWRDVQDDLQDLGLAKGATDGAECWRPEGDLCTVALKSNVFLMELEGSKQEVWRNVAIALTSVSLALAVLAASYRRRFAHELVPTEDPDCQEAESLSARVRRLVAGAAAKVSESTPQLSARSSRRTLRADRFISGNGRPNQNLAADFADAAARARSHGVAKAPHPTAHARLLGATIFRDLSSASHFQRLTIPKSVCVDASL